MKKPSTSEKLLLEEVSKLATALQGTTQSLSAGDFVKLIRSQLKMSQGALAKRAGLPQSTISRIEHNKTEPTLSVLSKIFNALSCSFVTAPALNKPIDIIRTQQARRIAEQRVQYLRGTMSLEKQEPDNHLLEELIKKEMEELLHASGSQLWEE
ncbi:helix-turn-helix domain-containing protein [Candidatus Babeliales bacterium]|nr:helix-turn-helix domain-containing protein [Candidatus Babeliales bacterium]